LSPGPLRQPSNPPPNRTCGILLAFHRATFDNIHICTVDNSRVDSRKRRNKQLKRFLKVVGFLGFVHWIASMLVLSRVTSLVLAGKSSDQQA